MKIKEAGKKVGRRMTMCRVKEFLDKAPLDEVYSADEVSKKLDLNLQSTSHILKILVEREETFRLKGATCYYGKKGAIEALKKEIGL